MKMVHKVSLLLAVAFATGMLFAAGNPYSLEATLTPSDGLVPCGGAFAIDWRLLKDGQPAVGEKLRYTLQWERNVVRQETIETTAKAARIEYRSERPGWMYLSFQVLGADG